MRATLVRRRRVLARRTPRAPSSTSSPRSCRRRSMPARPPSTSRIPSATRRRRSSTRCSTYLRDTVRGIERRHAVGALPRRSRHGGRQQPRAPCARRAPGRMHDQRHRRARRQLLAGRGGDGARTCARRSSACARASRPSACIRPAAWSRRSPACRCRATRRSSARTRSRTRPASTSTACSGTRRPTRSCGRRTSGCRAATWCSASTAAATPSATACSELGFELDEEEINAVFTRFKALADKKKELFDGDIEALVLQRRWRQRRARGRSRRSRTDGRDRPSPCAAVVLAPRRTAPASEAATGDGPVDAAFTAIERRPACP